MSLKAKLEAVIYAAEEPVTLAQLALLFTADALEWKAEQEAAAADAANPAPGDGDSLPLETAASANEEVDYAALNLVAAETAPEATAEVAAEPVNEGTLEAGTGEAAAAWSEGEDAE